MRGPLVMAGYRNDPERTAEAIDPDGWLHTGDVAEIDDDGYVRIVDRKKELIINAAGKNMSPANIEAAVKSSSPLIGQAVCIERSPAVQRRLDRARPRLRAGIRRAERAGERRSRGAGALGARDRGDRRPIERANAYLSRVEQIKHFLVLDAEWLPGGEELTPTMKLKRKPIAAKYEQEIEGLYADTDG
jgi:long-subunit acyl-CoA synthetase (AMP-forming)